MYGVSVYTVWVARGMLPCTLGHCWAQIATRSVSLSRTPDFATAADSSVCLREIWEVRQFSYARASEMPAVWGAWSLLGKEVKQECGSVTVGQLLVCSYAA